MIRTLLSVALLVGATVFGSAQAQTRLTAPLKIAFVLYGNVSDGSWTETQTRAREQLEQKFGVKIPYVQRVPETTEQVRRAVDLFIRRGTKLVIGGSYGYSDAFKAAAEANPDVNFINIAGVTAAPNLESFYIRDQEGWYLAGMAAALATRTNVVGFVSSVPISQDLMAVNGFARGAQSINPKIRIKASFTNAWDDPVKDGQFSAAMIEQGVDVLATGLDSTAGVLAGERAGIYTIGSQNDMSAAAPKGMLTSVVLNWDRKLIPMIEAMQAGTWKSAGTPLYGIKDGLLDITPVAHMTPAGEARIKAARQAIIDGTLDPLGGPVVAQDGSIKLAAGQHFTDQQLNGMNFLVAGVEGSIK